VREEDTYSVAPLKKSLDPVSETPEFSIIFRTTDDIKFPKTQ
jgi:hypothetical protein